jgi:hypothetical protein
VCPIERTVVAFFAADIAGCNRLIAQDALSSLTQLEGFALSNDGLIATHSRAYSRRRRRLRGRQRRGRRRMARPISVPDNDVLMMA